MSPKDMTTWEPWLKPPRNQLQGSGHPADNDLATSLEWWLMRELILKWPYFSYLKVSEEFFDLARSLEPLGTRSNLFNLFNSEANERKLKLSALLSQLNIAGPVNDVAID